jgi:hypothetical protein
MSICYILLGFYICVNFLIAKWVNKSQDKNYKQILTDDGECLHDKYSEFRRYDQRTSFWKIFLGLIFLFWIRVFLSIFIITATWFFLK